MRTIHHTHIVLYAHRRTTTTLAPFTTHAHNHHHPHHSALALLEEEMARITAVHINDKEAACAALRQLLEREVQDVQEAHDARARAPQQQPMVVGPMPPSGHGLSNMLNQKTAKLQVWGWGGVGSMYVGVMYVELMYVG